MKNKRYPIERKQCLQLFLILILYLVIGIGIFLMLDYVLPLFSNSFILWIYLRLDVIFVLYLVMGLGGIFYYFWKKPWLYLNEVIEATKEIHKNNSNSIELSEPLRDIESQMNQIKMSVLLNRQAAKEAEDKKNELVMYLAHDIRTPLTIIMGYLNLLIDAEDMPVKQKTKYIEIALEKSERLEKLINELFEITRFHANTVSLKKEKMDLYCLLAQLTEEFYPTVSLRGNSIILNSDENMVLLADPEKLARVFANLLKNAVSYSYPNTEIFITAKMDQSNAIISIKNCGSTIPEEQLSNIFEKFTRLDEARVSDTGGAGLGLFIAQKIIHLHGGQITVKSENETVTFFVRLPLLT